MTKRSEDVYDAFGEQVILEPHIVVTRLSSGYYHIRGNGPCEWAQVERWPCDETALRAGAFPEASDTFIRAALAKITS